MAYAKDEIEDAIEYWQEVRKSQRRGRPSHVVSTSGLYVDLPSPQKQKHVLDYEAQPPVNEDEAPRHVQRMWKSGLHRRFSLEDTWKVRVDKTFLNIVNEDQGKLRHVSSAPGKLESTPFETFDLADSASSSSISDSHNVSAKSIDSTAASVQSLEAGSDDDTISNDSEVKSVCALGTGAAPQNLEFHEAQIHACEPHVEISKQKSRTAKRNQRRRAQASMQPLDVGSDDELNSHDFEAKVACALGAMDVSETQVDESAQEGENCDGKKKRKAAKRNKRRRAQEKSEKAVPAEAVKSDCAQEEPKPSSVRASYQTCDNTLRLVPDRVEIKETFLKVFRSALSCGGSSLMKSKTQQKQIGVLTPEQLAKFDCKSHRPLVSIHGDIFDVSNSPDTYGPKGIHRTLSGRDITWGIISGSYRLENLNCFHDLFKADEKVLVDRLMPVLCKAIVDHECKHGKPVGRLSVFQNEETLPPPPLESMVDCVVM